MIESPLVRLARLVGYPLSEIDAEGARADLEIDDYSVAVERIGGDERSVGGRLRFGSVLMEAVDARTVDLVQYAAGRVMRESATLAYDDDHGTVFLWDEVSTDLKDAELAARFAAFLDSCDWWRQRVAEAGTKSVKVPSTVIWP